MSLLKTKDVTIKFGGLVAVNTLNINVEEGEIVAIIGPNGAGKTTAFNLITGVYAPTEGEILFNDKIINGKRPDEIAKLGIARTFQNIRLFKDLTVLENVLIATHLNVKSGLFSSVLKLPKARKEEKEMIRFAENLLEETGLLQFKDEIASNLPYGLQRRLEIARALATKPKLLLLDEPAAGMNPKESDDLTDFIREIRDKFKLTVLLIEHHMQLVMGISDRIYVLEYGTTIASGVPSEIQANPAVIKAYLGEGDE
ncbi:MAG: ABC transporter ATP-binding protein [Lachnospirales bacterium]